MPKKHMILLSDIPKDLKAVSDRIGLLANALDAKRDKTGLTPAESRDWGQLLDYWSHVEVLQKVKKHDDVLETDPLALLNIAEKFNLAAPEQIATLREGFHKKVTRIIGHDLTPRQVRQMYELLIQFNPIKPT